MGNWFTHKVFAPNIEYLIFEVLYPGGWGLFYIFEFLYIYLFDWNVRKPVARMDFDIYDWENPKIVGRNRRRMKCFSRNFLSKDNAIEYWRLRNNLISMDETTSEYELLRSNAEQLLNECRIMLTNPPGGGANNNDWEFALVGFPTDEPAGWQTYSDSNNNNKWVPMEVPSHWQLKGFDIPIYTNTSYPFQMDPPYARRTGKWSNQDCDVGLGADTKGYENGKIHEKEPGENATGLYRRKFQLKTNWEHKSMKYFLVLEGVDSSATIWLNGKEIGYSQDSCLSAEFDITDSLLPGEGMDQLLAVRVTRWCDGSYLEDQDKWWLSGIYREVFVVCRPHSFISDFEFSSSLTLSDSSVEAVLSVTVLAENIKTVSKYSDNNTGNNGSHSVRAELWDFNTNSDEPVLVLSSSLMSTDLRDCKLPTRFLADEIIDCEVAETKLERIPVITGISTLSGLVQNPTLWSDEKPHLYTLIVSLYDSQYNASVGSSKGCLVVDSCRVGFRKVSIDSGVLRLNEHPIIIAGINRHEFDPLTGRAVSEKSMYSDARIIKKLNFNAVRTSHYPNHPFWLEICDELGLLVIDEANIETHGFQSAGQPIGYLAGLQEWQEAFASRIIRMYERDKNFSCVIGWSLGNESGYGRAHDSTYRWLKTRDSSRFVQYESGGARTNATDIICPMYTRPGWCRRESLRDKNHRPVILCEYAHAMGNSGGSLKQYWDDFRNSDFPSLQGGFIWDFVDQGILLVDAKNPKAFGYGGDFGDLPNTKQFCCNGILAPDREFLPGAIEAAYLQSPIDVSLTFDISSDPIVEIRNRRFHSDLSDLVVSLTLFYQPTVLSKTLVFNKFEIPCGHIVPNQSDKTSVKAQLTTTISHFVNSHKEAHSLYINMTDSEVWFDVSVVNKRNGNEILHKSLDGQMLKSWVSSSIKSFSKMTTNGNASHTDHDVQNGNLSISYNESIVNGLSVLNIQFSNGASAKIGKICGRLISWCDHKGVELLSSPVDICLYRAGTDNDRGGSIFSYYSRWKEIGLDSLIRKTKNKRIESCGQNSDGSVNVHTKWTLVNTNNSPTSIGIDCQVVYKFVTNGSIDISYQVSLPLELPPIPRFGIRFSIPNSYKEAQWFGLGPHESYIDRNSSAYVGVFSSKVSNLHTNYTFPQENGRRSGLRWITFTSKSNESSLSVVTHEKSTEDRRKINNWGFNASPYPLEQLDFVTHNYKLIESDDIHVHFDQYSMGVGGYDSWSPNVLSESLITSGQVLESKLTLMYKGNINA